jgi:hypothetical protein
VTTNAVSKIIQIPTSAAVEAFFIARMARYPSSTVRFLANGRHAARARAAQFFEAKKVSPDPVAIQTAQRFTRRKVYLALS